MATSWQGTLLRRLILVLFSFFVPLAYPLGAIRGQGGFKMCHGICYFLEKKGVAHAVSFAWLGCLVLKHTQKWTFNAYLVFAARDTKYETKF